MPRRIFAFLIFFLIISTTFFNAHNAKAAGATLFISPSSGNYTVGKSFTVKVMIDSGGGLGINAGEGKINFDSEYLTVSNVSDSGTIFKLWVTEPTYSNQNGTISFGGGLPGAYKGSAGLIFSVTFKSKKVGSTDIKFGSGAVLAPDGKGTDVLEGYGSATITISEAKKEEPKEDNKPKTETKKEESKGIVPPKPEIITKTHSDPKEWYQNNKPEFSWKLIADLSGISFGYTENESDDPGNQSDGVIENKRYEVVKDGEWYFHLKYQNKAGWGPIAHKKFMIDSTPPTISSIRVDNGGDQTNPTPILKVKTNDDTSGILKYNLIIDDGPEEVGAEKFVAGEYKLKVIQPGEHKLQLVAIDRADNQASSSVSFYIEPLKSPVITDIPKVIKKNEELIIRGTSFYPSSNINLYIAKDGDEPKMYSIRTDEAGNWTYFHKEKLEKSNYEIYAILVDDRGAQSFSSSRHVMTVISPSVVELYGWFIIFFLILVIIGLLMLINYMKHKFDRERERIARETNEAKIRLTEIFTALREEVDELMELADKKPGLSESERRVKDKLQEALDISEEFISKEIDDVNKEITIKTKKE